MTEKPEYTEIPELSKAESQRVIARVDEWLEFHQGEGFLPQDIFEFYSWRLEPAIKRVVANHLYYLTHTQSPPTLKKAGKYYRTIDREVDTIDWKRADPKAYFDITLPFDLHKYIRLHRRSVMVIGGVWSAGKTTLIHNIISLNIARHEVVLFDSENSAEELAGRFVHYPNYESWPADFVKDRSTNFADCIQPDAINFIDYIEIPDNFYLIGRLLREIRDPLRDGIVIATLQKKKNAELPIGGMFALHLPRVVLTMDNGRLTIIKAKDRAQKNINPVNMQWTFRIDDTGTKFLNPQRSYGQSMLEEEGG